MEEQKQTISQLVRGWRGRNAKDGTRKKMKKNDKRRNNWTKKRNWKRNTRIWKTKSRRGG